MRGFRFVTCLCLTRNRRQWLPKAIECFLRQTYRPCDLMIIADGEDVRDLVPAHDRISLVEIQSGFEIGSKRNFGCERARGSVIAHWDDDDYSSPGRIADQIQRMAASGKVVTGYHSMRFTDGAQWWKYEGTRNYALGTSLCYEKLWWKSHPFPGLQIGEDNQFVTAAWAAQQLESVDAGDLMYATIHSGNTSPRSLNSSSWKLCA